MDKPHIVLFVIGSIAFSSGVAANSNVAIGLLVFGGLYLFAGLIAAVSTLDGFDD